MTVKMQNAIPAAGGKRYGIDPNFVVTRAGSTVFSLAWDMSGDVRHNAGMRVFRWGHDVVLKGHIIGRLSDISYAGLLQPLQAAIGLRWQLPGPDEGPRWGSGGTAMAYMIEARVLAKWMAAQGVMNLSQMSAALFKAYCAERVDQVTRRAERLIDIVRRLSPRMGITLGFEAKDMEAPTISWRPSDEGEKSAPGKKKANRRSGMPLIPKPIFDHLFGYALNYQNIWGKDVCNLREAVEDLKSSFEAKLGKPMSKGVWTPLFKEWMDAQSRLLAEYPLALDPRTGHPWRAPITNWRELEDEEIWTRTALALLLAFPIGGRNSEVTGLKRDRSIKLLRDKRGRVYGCHIFGTVFKGKGRKGLLVEWEVVPEVAETVFMCRRLCRYWTKNATGVPHLLTSVRGTPLKVGMCNKDLRRFGEHCGVPFHNGVPFNLTSHFSRIALAQWLAREPNGIVAGALHLKQHSVRAFEGYLREDAPFMSVYKYEQLEASAERELLILKEPVVAGGYGSELLPSRSPDEQRRLTAQVGTIAASSGEAAREGDLNRARKAGKQIYPTGRALCVFRPATALCLAGVPMSERTRPRTHQCDPWACKNGAITRWQVGIWLQDILETVELMDRRETSPGQRKLYVAQIADLKAKVAPFRSTLEEECKNLRVSLQSIDQREARFHEGQQRLQQVEDQVAIMKRLRIRDTEGDANA